MRLKQEELVQLFQTCSGCSFYCFCLFPMLGDELEEYAYRIGFRARDAKVARGVLTSRQPTDEGHKHTTFDDLQICPRDHPYAPHNFHIAINAMVSHSLIPRHPILASGSCTNTVNPTESQITTSTSCRPRPVAQCAATKLPLRTKSQFR